MGAYLEHHVHSLSAQIACMNFINVVVHTTEDLNYRVYLQHEFSLLGIDDFLEDLEARSADLPTLKKQIKAYQENYFNVAILVRFYTCRHVYM
jgi:hypothetical protein